MTPTHSINVSGNTPPKAKLLTRAQKLAKALKACERKPKKQRTSCVKQAQKRYGMGPKKGGKNANGKRKSKT